ncbi:MAG: PorP/SprF family type IX secretion system membrane protein [Bacteroidota bacterium]
MEFLTKNIRRVILLLGMSFSLPLPYVSAQLLPLMLNNRDNLEFFNPAMPAYPLMWEKNYGNDFANTIVGLSSRRQWTNFGSDAPWTNYFRASHKFHPEFKRRKDDFLWLSTFFMADKTGPASLNTFGINASYHMNISDDTYLSAGLSLRYSNNNLKRDDIILSDSNDEGLANFNPQGFLNSGMGIFLNNRKFYLGVSIPNTVLFNNNIDGLGLLSDHIYGALGAYFSLSRQLYLEPSIWVRRAENLTAINSIPFFYDLGFKVTVTPRGLLGKGNRIQRKLWAGVGYDASKAARAEAGLLYDKFSFNFIYNYYLSSTTSNFGSGLELGINLFFE